MTGFLIFLACFIGYGVVGITCAAAMYGLLQRRHEVAVREHDRSCTRCKEGRVCYDLPRTPPAIGDACAMTGFGWPVGMWIVLGGLLFLHMDTRRLVAETNRAERQRFLAEAMKELGDD